MNPHLRLIRLHNCLMASLAVPVVLFIIHPTYIQQSYLSTLMASIIVFLVTAGGNTLNDYVDREIDKINHPNRPIPSGEIQPQKARRLSVILFLLAVLIALFMTYFLVFSLLTLCIVVVAIVLLILYETTTKRKGFAGNINVSFLVGLIFIYAGSLTGDIIKSFFPFLLAFLSNVGREIAKDIEDVVGDINRKTLPMRIGIMKAKEVSAGFFLSAVALSPLPYLLSLFTIYYIPVVIIADILFILSSLVLFYNAGKAQRISKLAMVVGLLAFLAGGF